jgi:hypothetical protein
MKAPNFASLAAKASITLLVDYDETPVRGNAMASGDATVDKRYEDRILARLERGDVWAWAVVIVEAKLGGFSGRTVLGTCSYRNEKEFRRKGGYFADMVADAREALAIELKMAWVTLTQEEKEEISA